AWLRVDSVLSGAATVGERIHVAWEELAGGRPPRLSNGERILVVLAPLPKGSLWSTRFPNAFTGSERVLAIGAKGDAFLRDPDAHTIELSPQYLTRPPAPRPPAAGVTILARLVAEAAPGLGAAALMRLDQTAGLGAALDAPAVTLLRQALLDPQRP